MVGAVSVTFLLSPMPFRNIGMSPKERLVTKVLRQKLMLTGLRARCDLARLQKQDPVYRKAAACQGKDSRRSEKTETIRGACDSCKGLQAEQNRRRRGRGDSLLGRLRSLSRSMSGSGSGNEVEKVRRGQGMDGEE